MKNLNEEWKVKLRAMRHYDAIASGYDELYGMEQLAKMKSIDKRIDLEAGDAVLDVGCGTGLFFDFAASKSHLLVGLDLSSELLKRAKEKGRNYSNVYLVRADAEHLPFKEYVFDKVFSITLLQNIPNPRRFFKELIRVSKSRGEGIITALKKKFDKRKLTSILKESNLNFRFLEEETKDYIIHYRIWFPLENP